MGINLDWQSDKKGGSEDDFIDMIVNLRLEARKNKDFATSDVIRNILSSLGISLNDTKGGTTWEKI